MTSESRRRALWYAPAVVVTLMLWFLAVGLVLDGRALPGAAVFLWSVLWAWQRVQMRREYRQGWRAGFAEAMSAEHETRAGRVPAFVLRAQMHGDATPEPWDGVLSPTRVEAGVIPRPERGDEPPST